MSTTPRREKMAFRRARQSVRFGRRRRQSRRRAGEPTTRKRRHRKKPNKKRRRRRRFFPLFLALTKNTASVFVLLCLSRNTTSLFTTNDSSSSYPLPQNTIDSKQKSTLSKKSSFLQRTNERTNERKTFCRRRLRPPRSSSSSTRRSFVRFLSSMCHSLLK